MAGGCFNNYELCSALRFSQILPAAARYSPINSLLVFALAERKNEQRSKEKYRSAEGSMRIWTLPRRSYQHETEEKLMSKHVIARCDEIPPGGRKIVRVAGREVGVFNIDGTFYALKNVCPHQGARVCLGRIVGTALPSEVYQYAYGREGQILRCPWHEWEYDIATGESLFDPNVKVVSYPVEVLGDDIVVTIGP